MATFNWTSSTQYLDMTSTYVQPSGDVTITLWVNRSASTVGDGYEMLFMPASEPLHLYYAGWSDEMSASRKFATGAQDAGFSGNTGGTWEFWKFHQDGGDTTSDYWTAENDGTAATRSYEDEYAVGSPLSTAVTSIVIGANDVGTEGFLGAMAHIAIWDGVLTATQLTALEGGGNPVAVEAIAGGTATLDLYFPLWDLTEYVNSGTLTNNGSVGTTTGPTVDGIPGAIAGTAAGVATVTAVIADAVSEAVAATAAGVATVTGTLSGEGAVAGVSAGVATVAGDVMGVANIAGLAAGSATATALLRGIGDIAGVVAGAATVTGSLSADAMVTLTPGTTYQELSGIELILSQSGNDIPVASGGGYTGWHFEYGSGTTRLDEMATEVAAAGITHFRIDLHCINDAGGGSWSADPGTYTSPTTYTAGSPTIDNRHVDAKADLWLRTQAAVIAAGNTPSLIINFVAWRNNSNFDYWDNPSGSEGQDYADIALLFLERFRTHGIVPNRLAFCNEPDNQSLSPNVTPAIYRRGADLLMTDMAAVSGTPYSGVRLVVPTCQRCLSADVDPYLSEFNTNSTYPMFSWPGGVGLGYHLYNTSTPTTAEMAGVAALAVTYGLDSEPIEMNEYWGYVHEPAGETRNLVYNLLNSGDASVLELSSNAFWAWTAVNDEEFGWFESTADGNFPNVSAHNMDSAMVSLLGVYVPWMKPGSTMIDTAVVQGAVGTVRATSWTLADGRQVVVVEETSNNATTYDVSGISAGLDHTLKDDGSTQSQLLSRLSVPIAANGLEALIFADSTPTTAGTAAGAATIAGLLSGPGAIAGTSTGTSTVTATLTSEGPIAGTAAGVATVAGAVVGAAGLAGLAAGTATTQGTLAATGAVAALAAGSATTQGALLGVGSIAALAAGTATVSGSISSGLGLAGTANGTSTVSGTLQASGAVAVVAPGVATVSATLTGVGSIAGTSAGTATVSGTMTLPEAIAGTAAGVATVSGAVTDANPTAVRAASTGSSTVSGTLRAVGHLSATAAGVATPQATLSALGAIGGTSAGAAAAAGTLFQAMPGLAAGVATVSGTLSGWGFLDATAAGSAAVSGALGGIASFSGAAAGTSVVTGLVRGVGPNNVVLVLTHIDDIPVLHETDTIPVVDGADNF